MLQFWQANLVRPKETKMVLILGYYIARSCKGENGSGNGGLGFDLTLGKIVSIFFPKSESHSQNKPKRVSIIQYSLLSLTRYLRKTPIGQEDRKLKVFNSSWQKSHLFGCQTALRMEKSIERVRKTPSYFFFCAPS